MGLTRIKAEQISDIDYKQAVRVITLSNITLAGGAPSTVDSVNLVVGDRVLVAGQGTGSQNGLYYVSTLGTGANGTWTRTSDGNTDGEIEAGMIVMVTEGTVYKDTQWKLTTNNPIVIGTTALTFEQNSAFAFGNIYANGTAVLATSVGDSVTLTAGDNVAITGNNTTKTVTIAVTGLSLNSISNGASNVNVVSSGGNVTIGVSGTDNVAVFGQYQTTFTGNVLPAANITYDLGTTSQRWRDLWLANSTIYLGSAQISANATSLILTNPGGGTTVLTGASPVIQSSTVSASGNITGGNLLTGGLVSSTGNVTGGNLLTAGLISSTGTITGGNLSATNVTGTLTTASQPNITSVGTLTSLNSGAVSSSGNVTGANLLTSGLVSAAGNISANYFLGNGSQLTGIVVSAGASIINGTSNVTVAQDANTTIGVNGTTIATFAGTGLSITGLVSASGNVSGSNVLTSGTISATGNITSAGTIKGANIDSTNADLAEHYMADQDYEPGTVVVFGGIQEITKSGQYADPRVAGVISTAPAHTMNSDSAGLPVALQGRVPCLVVGTVRKGDLVTTSDRPGVATRLEPGDWVPGCVIGKSLEEYDDIEPGVIEVAVGRL